MDTRELWKIDFSGQQPQPILQALTESCRVNHGLPETARGMQSQLATSSEDAEERPCGYRSIRFECISFARPTNISAGNSGVGHNPSLEQDVVHIVQSTVEKKWEHLDELS